MMTKEESKNVREQLAKDILSLTDEQATYVLRRLKCLLQSERSGKRTKD